MLIVVHSKPSHFRLKAKVHPMALCGHHPSDPISYHFPLTCSPLAILASYSVLNHIPPRPASGPVRLLLSLSPMLFPLQQHDSLPGKPCVTTLFKLASPLPWHSLPTCSACFFSIALIATWPWYPLHIYKHTVCLLVQNSQVYKVRDFCWVCALPYPQYLEKGQAQSRSSWKSFKWAHKRTRQRPVPKPH